VGLKDSLKCSPQTSKITLDFSGRSNFSVASIDRLNLIQKGVDFI